MKKIAIVITTNVWRRVRSAISPIGIAISPATSPATGTSANTAQPAANVQVPGEQRERVGAACRRTRRGRARCSPRSPRTCSTRDAETMKISVNTAIEVVVGLVKTSGNTPRTTTATATPAARAGECIVRSLGRPIRVFIAP